MNVFHSSLVNFSFHSEYYTECVDLENEESSPSMENECGDGFSSEATKEAKDRLVNLVVSVMLIFFGGI